MPILKAQLFERALLCELRATLRNVARPLLRDFSNAYSVASWFNVIGGIVRLA